MGGVQRLVLCGMPGWMSYCFPLTQDTVQLGIKKTAVMQLTRRTWCAQQALFLQRAGKYICAVTAVYFPIAPQLILPFMGMFFTSLAIRVFK